MKKVPKQKPFDLWAHVKERIRDRFYRFPPYRETLDAARTETSRFKKDGTLAKRPIVRYKCAHCGEAFARKDVQVDHIDPVVDPEKGRESISTLIKRQFTDKLQVLCKPCHKAKTNEERKRRKKKGG
jgi:5-methylcytosine-specific restriction endonuclease McrA